MHRCIRLQSICKQICKVMNTQHKFLSFLFIIGITAWAAVQHGSFLHYIACRIAEKWTSIKLWPPTRHPGHVCLLWFGNTMTYQREREKWQILGICTHSCHDRDIVVLIYQWLYNVLAQFTWKGSSYLSYVNLKVCTLTAISFMNLRLEIGMLDIS